MKRLLGILFIALFITLSISAVQAGRAYYAAHAAPTLVSYYDAWLAEHIFNLNVKIVAVLAVGLLLPGVWLIRRR